MRFKLLCFPSPLKVAFVITSQYLAINISDTPWLSWHSHLCSRQGKVALLRMGPRLGSWNPIISFSPWPISEKSSLEQKQMWRRAKRTTRSQDDLCSRPTPDPINPRSTTPGFRILSGKGEISDSMTSQILPSAKTLLFYYKRLI